MLFGNPYKISFLVEMVPEWSDDSFKNGLLFVIIDGFMFPCITDKPSGNVPSSTLGVDMSELTDGVTSAGFVSFINDEFLFNRNKEDAFLFMLKKHLGIEIETEDWCYEELGESNFVSNFYGYSSSSPILTDNSCYIFAVACGCRVRILGAKIPNFPSEISSKSIRQLTIKETIVDKEYLSDMVDQMKEYGKKILSS